MFASLLRSYECDTTMTTARFEDIDCMHTVAHAPRPDLISDLTSSIAMAKIHLAGIIFGRSRPLPLSTGWQRARSYGNENFWPPCTMRHAYTYNTAF